MITFEIIEVADKAKFYFPMPVSMLKTMGWKEGDQLKPEIVVNRDGSMSHIVLEKVDG